MKIQTSTTNIMKAQAMFKKVAVFAVSAVFFFCIANVAQAQDRIYKPFRVGFGGGYAFGGTSTQEITASNQTFEVEYTGAKGFTFWLEPQYGITDKIGVGLRYQGFLTLNEETTVNGKVLPDDAELAGITAYSLQGDYFFVNSHPWRLSAGLGIGLYSQASVGTLTIEEEVLNSLSEDVKIEPEKASGIGIAPRVRGQIGPFEIGIAYHLTFSEEVYNLFALDFGFEIGGRRYE